jgi:hypothetical protein
LISPLAAAKSNRESQMQSWFKIAKSKDETSASISIFSEIGGWGVSALDFQRELRALDG